MGDVQGIDQDAVEAWYLANVEGTETPLSFDLIAGGHSNLTFAVTDASGRKTVLRRPPLGQVLASAHDMGREHKIIAALADTQIPVAATFGYEPDDAVNGAPFYVMDHVDGHVLRDRAAAEKLSVEARTHAGHSLVDVMAAIHSVDPDAVGLGDLGRKEGYIERQLKRWYGQWNKSKTRELPEVDAVHDALLANIPEQGPAAIVHGDYRLDNCMVDDNGDVIAVLDWELCTLGDPMADLGLLMVYWSEPGDVTPTLGAPTLSEGMISRAEAVERYAASSGRDVSNIDFYTAFGYWKLACIVEGVYARYVGGSMGAREGNDFDHFARQVEAMAAQATAALGRMD
ncbi:phosphotransferase family protein [Actinospongicola halichondriae]|uniref:phosphotransferase family protein n=1 Tax=Actinospongicola halichondriae TaxID=3236844 RepID=UPI003D502076